VAQNRHLVRRRPPVWHKLPVRAPTRTCIGPWSTTGAMAAGAVASMCVRAYAHGHRTVRPPGTCAQVPRVNGPLHLRTARLRPSWWTCRCRCRQRDPRPAACRRPIRMSKSQNGYRRRRAVCRPRVLPCAARRRVPALEPGGARQEKRRGRCAAPSAGAAAAQRPWRCQRYQQRAAATRRARPCAASAKRASSWSLSHPWHVQEMMGVCPEAVLKNGSGEDRSTNWDRGGSAATPTALLLGLPYSPRTLSSSSPLSLGADFFFC